MFLWWKNRKIIRLENRIDELEKRVGVLEWEDHISAWSSSSIHYGINFSDDRIKNWLAISAILNHLGIRLVREKSETIIKAVKIEEVKE